MKKDRWYPQGLPAKSEPKAEAVPPRQPSRARLTLRTRPEQKLPDLLRLAKSLHWYGILVSAQKEFVAQIILERYGLATYIPARHEWRKVSRYRKDKRVKTYAVAPRYVFVGFPPGVPLWFDLFSLPLVHSAVGINGEPKRIPAAAMEQLLRRTGSGLNAPDAHRFMKTHHEFAVGDQVEVMEGPFKGWKVPVTNIEGDMATLALQLFGGAVEAIEVPLEVLEAAE